MKIKQYKILTDQPSEPGLPEIETGIHLVLVFGSRDVLNTRLGECRLAERFPDAIITGCSTSGEIQDVSVYDDSLVITTVSFEKTQLKSHFIGAVAGENSFETGKSLAGSFETEGLRHLFVLSDGIHVNGSEMVKGITSQLPPHVTVTGGLAGDGDRFEQSLVVWQGTAKSGLIVGVGFYGESLKVGYGSLGGWDPFGPERLITKSKANKLFELDGRNALQLYKSYLGDQAAGLPGSALLFPLSLKMGSDSTPVVRTILSIDENEQSMTFAGDVPEGAYTQLMKANFDRLIDGASSAAKTTVDASGSEHPELAILISCVGRKMVLKQRIEEEVEAVRDVVGDQAFLTGFYSYGEISPFTPNAKCELHNQTMTITTFTEA